jgi:hypothetical protein
MKKKEALYFHSLSPCFLKTISGAIWWSLFSISLDLGGEDFTNPRSFPLTSGSEMAFPIRKDSSAYRLMSFHQASSFSWRRS